MQRIIFLHLPKTAGSTVRSELGRLFGPEVAPVSVNAQLRRAKAADLERYRVFCGHLDWRRLDFLTGPRVVFTVLRDPVQRIASEYLFHKMRAASLSRDEAAKNRDFLALYAMDFSLEDYFIGAIPERARIDDNYDNIYTYYFAGRRLYARPELRAEIGKRFASEQAILDLAHANIATLDFVCDIAEMDRLESFFRQTFGVRAFFASRRVNVNPSAGSRDRFEALRDHGLTSRVRDRIMEMAALDEALVARSLADQAQRHVYASPSLAEQVRRWAESTYWRTRAGARRALSHFARRTTSVGD